MKLYVRAVLAVLAAVLPLLEAGAAYAGESDTVAATVTLDAPAADPHTLVDGTAAYHDREGGDAEGCCEIGPGLGLRCADGSGRPTIV